MLKRTADAAEAATALADAGGGDTAHPHRSGPPPRTRPGAGGSGTPRPGPSGPPPGATLRRR
ncbi:hypothetical protein ACFWER_36315, partial [Streptomyces sp. NPDC060188]